MRDLVPVAPLMENDLVLVVNPSVPAKNLAELLALARAKPGTINFGSSGPGSNYHMAAELLKNLTGINIVHVPYKGSTGMRTDILSGQIQMLFDSDSDHGADGQGRHGARARHQRLKRSPILPDVPTIAEAGVPGFQFQPVGRLHGAEGHAAADRRPAQRTITAILSRPDIKAAWEAQGATPMVMTQAGIRGVHAGRDREMG